MKKRVLAAVLAVFLLIFNIVPAYANVLTDEDFSNLVWTKIKEEALQTQNGNLQSICATPLYIITIENVADDPNTPDVVSAYYRHDYDENGNPVEQYSLAMRSMDNEWEHGNGMAFNPNTGEIYVALYTNTIEENRGCLYVMDPNDLSYLRTIKVTDDFNILGIDYMEETDQYVIQSDADGEYRFEILDSNFQLVSDLGPADMTPALNSQDMCVVEDYIVNSPCGDGIKDYVYSLSRNVRVGSYDIGISEPDISPVEGFEVESFTMLSGGKMLMGGRVTKNDGWRYLCIYETTLPSLAEDAAAQEALTQESVAEESEPEEVEPVVITAEEVTPEVEESSDPALDEVQETEPEESSVEEVETEESDLMSSAEKFVAFTNVFTEKYLVISMILVGVLAVMILIIALYAHHVKKERERRRRIAMRRRARMRREVQRALESVDDDRDFD